MAATTDCNTPCGGNAAEYCGGGNRLDLYSGPATTPTSNPTSAPTSIGPGSATGLPAGWKYGGCFVDNLDGRILSVQQPDNQQLTIESCVNACIGAGYTVAGMEYSIQCFCGNEIINGGVLATQQTDCNANCGGSAAEQCGAGNRMSIYYTGTLVLKGPPTAKQTVGSWTYSGCIS